MIGGSPEAKATWVSTATRFHHSWRRTCISTADRHLKFVGSLWSPLQKKSECIAISHTRVCKLRLGASAIEHSPSICATLNAKPTNEQQASGCSSRSQTVFSIMNAEKVNKEGVCGKFVTRSARRARSCRRDASCSRDTSRKRLLKLFRDEIAQPTNMTAVSKLKYCKLMSAFRSDLRTF